jgi:hypothetical protein
LRPAVTDEPYAPPFPLLTAAGFDTEHEREPALAPSYGTVRVSHFFFAFGYPTSPLKPQKPEATAWPAASVQ